MDKSLQASLDGWEYRFEHGTWNRNQLLYWIDLFQGLIDYYESQLASGEIGPEMVEISKAVDGPAHTLEEYQALTRRLLAKTRARLDLANGRLLALAR
jgi:hypothetical protein